MPNLYNWLEETIKKPAQEETPLDKEKGEQIIADPLTQKSAGKDMEDDTFEFDIPELKEAIEEKVKDCCECPGTVGKRSKDGIITISFHKDSTLAEVEAVAASVTQVGSVISSEVVQKGDKPTVVIRTVV